MKSYDEWVIFSETDSRDEKKNAWGGLDPHNAKEKKVHKHVDLITLPPDVKGTNCFNCSYIEGIKDGVGYCNHEEIEQYVTGRMCCAYWNDERVKRLWQAASTK